jgi:hypothetical protein
VQAREQHGSAPPRLIDGGRVAQAIVEYTGNRLGTVTYRGRSGREYRFDASPWHKRNYVLAEDLERFRLRPDFRVIEESLIDPEAEKIKAIEKRHAEMLDRRDRNLVKGVGKVLDDWERAKRHRSSRKSGGRPTGKGLGARLDCWMNCGRLDQQFGTPRAAYDALYRYLHDNSPPGEYVPPRERFPSLRSDAKRKREGADGNCLWHKHPEPVPAELAQA